MSWLSSLLAGWKVVVHHLLGYFLHYIHHRLLGRLWPSLSSLRASVHHLQNSSANTLLLHSLGCKSQGPEMTVVQGHMSRVRSHLASAVRGVQLPLCNQLFLKLVFLVSKRASSKIWSSGYPQNLSWREDHSLLVTIKQTEFSVELELETPPSPGNGGATQQ